MLVFFLIWFFSLVIKLVLAFYIPLAPDEAYYWFWSQNLRLSYYDHPPFISWLMYWGDFFFGKGSGAVRFPGIIFGHCSLLIWWAILKDYFSINKINLYLALILCSPILGFGSIIQTPDTPMIFFWSLALYFLTRAVKSDRTQDWLLLGAALGFGFLSKYTIALFAPCCILWLWKEKKLSLVLSRRLAYVFFAGVVCSFPVWLWNYQNEWASFTFQYNHGLGRKWKPRWTIEYIVGQLMIIFPFIFILALKARQPKNFRWVMYFAFIPFAFFFFSSFKGRVQANWPAFALPCMYLLAAMATPSFKKIAWVLVVWIALGAGFIVQIFHPWLPYPEKKLKSYEFSMFNSVLSVPEQYPNVFAESYQMASVLNFYGKKAVYKLQHSRRRDFYDDLKESIPEKGKYYFLARHHIPFPPYWLKKGHKITNEIKLNDNFKLLEVHTP